MSLKSRIKDSFYTLTGRGAVVTVQVENKSDLKTKKLTRERSAAATTSKRQRFRMPQDIRSFEEAVTIAESQTHDRELLHKIYRNVVLEDPHVLSQWQNRKHKTLKRSFGIFPVDSDDKDDKLTALFSKSWFYEFLEKALEERAFGYVALELNNWNNQLQRFESYRGEDSLIYDAVQVIDHDFVKPETALIVHESSQISIGYDLLDLKDQIIYSGNKEHGFLYRLAKHCLFKQNALANWSEYIEVYGLDALVVMSGAEGQERTALLRTLEALGTTRTAVLDQDDTIETVASSKSDAFRVFEQMARYTDESISKIIFGQDVVSNNTGQVVGNVGENVANDYSESDARFLTYLVNDQLLPLMSNNGYVDLKGFEFRFEDKTGTRELKERAEIDKIISEMGFKHDVDQINERYGVNVEAKAPLELGKKDPKKDPEIEEEEEPEEEEKLNLIEQRLKALYNSRVAG